MRGMDLAGSETRHTVGSCKHSKWTVVFSKGQGVSWPAEELSASEEELCSLQLIIYLLTYRQLVQSRVVSLDGM